MTLLEPLYLVRYGGLPSLNAMVALDAVPVGQAKVGLLHRDIALLTRFDYRLKRRSSLSQGRSQKWLLSEKSTCILAHSSVCACVICFTLFESLSCCL